ncbi:MULTISPECIES: hypothetical protein [Lactobacillales]|uniref:hypothetical protein n=1 Tax=Lactobacillales TaxID=186826 RepID=UPI002FC87C2F
MTKKTKKYIDYIALSAIINLFIILMILVAFVLIIKSEKYPSGSFLLYYFSFGVMFSSFVSTYVLLKNKISPNFITFTIYKKAVTYLFSLVTITTILYTLFEGDEITQYFSDYESSKNTLIAVTFILTSLNLSNILLDFCYSIKLYYKKKKKLN